MSRTYVQCHQLILLFCSINGHLLNPVRCHARPRIQVWRHIDSTFKATVYNLFLPMAHGEPCVIFIQYAKDPDWQV